jgi:hypothetical protein
MRKYNLFVGLTAIVAMAIGTGCEGDTIEVNQETSKTELLVEKFDAAPVVDGKIDEMWGAAQKLIGTTVVPDLSARNTHLNSDGEGIEETLGLFAPYSGEEYDFTLRSGYYGDDIYLLMEWEDADDSKDRQSWYFDPADNLWKGEHKYANYEADKFYEDKFAFLFPVGEVNGFNSATCYATCHKSSTIDAPKDKHTRHYLTTEGQVVDMWHWKRVRGTYLGQVDDQQMVYDDPAKGSSANGRKGDSSGSGGYSNNTQTLSNGSAEVSVPKYVVPNQTEYYWISQDDIDEGVAKKVTAVDAEGVLTYEGGTIDPSTGGYEQGIGTLRIPSVTTKAFTEGRGDITIVAEYTGTGWVCEFTRKINTGDADDVVFDLNSELPFGLAIFNNAAIAHALKANLLMKFEQ